MGYRSDVRIITTKKGFNELKKYSDNYLKQKNWEYGNLLDSCDFLLENPYSKYFGWNSVKWYEADEDYEDVNAIMKGLQHLEEKDHSYRYARIGEDYSDIDESSFDSDNSEEKYPLEYPSIIRGFDDDYISEIFEKLDKETGDVEL